MKQLAEILFALILRAFSWLCIPAMIWTSNREGPTGPTLAFALLGGLAYVGANLWERLHWDTDRD